MPADLNPYVPRLANQSIMVIGDVMLDEYITGKPVRMSREAPVPVLELESKRYIAGGAANPSANIVSLGSSALQLGITGADEAGERLTRILEDQGIDTRGLIRCDDRPTTVKTRILAQMGLRFPQQVTRIDTLTRRPIDSDSEARIVEFVRRQVTDMNAVLLSHYHGGLLTPTLVESIRDICGEAGVLLTADVQGKFSTFSALDVIKCNADDASRYLNRALETDDDFAEAVMQLHRTLGIQEATIITRGGHGATLIAGGEARHCTAPKVSNVFDTVGAGDTAIATTTLALAAGIAPADAVALANYASGIVVRHLGNYAPSPEELTRSISETL